ncbi:hypothetical protein M011DRAFT_214586 [Sporormia fimetaria CBS 119925]|uniref:Uncharacterized protein n=1 Tax=Sporormia fimetaria CBS 119925 TaxID=1340428 RepID=A0A6A6V389_9PLEO|nr:hypothetical protein M011DRAFT_214586 [Sporormia fimetaria CBS 119925]
MPPKRKNTDDGDDQGPPKKKGQAAPHARGGTHRVKVEDLTNTKYDTWNRAQLEAEFRDRRHIYVKDLKKAEIAKRLADDDAKQAEKQKEKDEKRKKEYEARKKNADAEARRKADDDRRRREREAKKARDEEARLERERQIQAGKAQAVQEVESAEESYFSDSDSNSGITVRHESDYASTTPTETSPSTVPESPLFPNARLRMMEWSRSEPDGVPPEVVPPEWRQWRPNVGALRGMKLEYFPMDLVTIFTNERVPMPGMKNPEKIGPDWVPNLTENVKRCARNGVLIGTLAKAQIVRGEIWSQRTVVQYTEGHMYFKLVPRAQNAPNYAVVQRAWKRKYWPKKPRDPKNGHVYERTPEEKARAFKDYREIKQKERFATQVGRPYIGFAPVHLDYPRRHRKKDGARRRDNLFFIKFPGEILPSFHFWTREGEWQDPTRPNPEYANLKRLYEEVDEQQQGVERLLEHKTALFLSKPRTGDGRPYKLDPEYVRIKKRDLSERYTVAGKRPPQGGIYERTVGRIEREIVANGLHSTLLKYRDQWRAEGKSRHWDALSKDFFVLFPGGYMPKVPPMHEENIPSSSWAEKIARLEFPERNRPMSPIRGDEPWTTNDDIWWQAVSKEGYEAERQLAQEANELKAGEEDGAEDDASEDEITQRDPVAFHDAFVDEASESEEEESSGFAAPLVLARRLSTFGRQKLTELDSWIRNVPLASPPWSAVSPRWTATEQSTDRKAWEERFERAAEHLRRRKLIAGHVNETDELSLSCPICAQDWTDTSSNVRIFMVSQTLISILTCTSTAPSTSTSTTSKTPHNALATARAHQAPVQPHSFVTASQAARAWGRLQHLLKGPRVVKSNSRPLWSRNGLDTMTSKQRALRRVV